MPDVTAPSNKSADSAGVHPVSHAILRTGGLLLFLLLAMVLAAQTAAASARVPDEEGLRASIRTEGVARVLVRLNTPDAKRLATAAFSYRPATPHRKFSQEALRADRSLAAYIHTITGRVISGLLSASYKINRTYDYFPFIAMNVSGKALDTLEASPLVSAIVADRPVPLPPTERKSAVDLQEIPSSAAKPRVYPVNFDNIGAEAAWAKGYTGAGWYVAILDSGVLTGHELFTGKNFVEACFSGTINTTNDLGFCPNGKNTMYGPGAAAPFSSRYDGYEHGTHVAGIAAGNSGSLFGVARDANIIAVQIFSPLPASFPLCGGTPCLLTFDSDQLAGLNYILSIRGAYPIAAVNMSLGGSVYYNQTTCDTSSDNALMKEAIDALRNAGIATVSVSGNDGACHAMEAPGCISSAIGVGAVDDSDQEASFNDWQYSMLDLLAPGVHIYSAIPDSPTSYAYLSGTSMAAPQVTGAWAILKQENPPASVSDILYALESTGVPVHSLCTSINDYKPRINVDSALTPYLIPVPTTQAQFDYHATDSPVLNMFYLPYPIGVGPVAGSEQTVNVRVGLYAFAGPVDLYVAVYVPALDDNYYVLTPGFDLKPLSTEGLVPWKHAVTGPIDESLFGEILSSQLPAATYYIYLFVTPPDRTDTYYLWSTSFVNAGF